MRKQLLHNLTIGMLNLEPGKYNYCKKLTLPEVVLAMFVLATALIPIFGLLTQDVKDTDVLVSQNFAIDRARLVLNTLLEEIPFDNLLPGNPAILAGPKAAEWANTLFPGASTVGGGYACQGIASDSRGIFYHIYLRSDPVEDTSPATYTAGELYFTYYKNPTVEDQHPGWASMSERAATAEKLDNRPSIFDNPPGVVSPYRYLSGPPNTTLWGPQHETTYPQDKVKIDQSMLARPRANGRIYLIQRLILQIRWNLAMSEYKNPTSNRGRPQRFHVVTFKGDIQ